MVCYTRAWLQDYNAALEHGYKTTTLEYGSNHNTGVVMLLNPY